MSWWKKLISLIFPEPENIVSTIVPKTKIEVSVMSDNLVYYKPEHFRVEEFVDPATFKRRGADALNDMDTRILITADEIRVYFNKKITINNWVWGKEREWSGLRTKDSPYFSYDSQHSFGRALDFLVDGIDAQEVRDEIKTHQDHHAFRFITRMEEFKGQSWCHIDCKNWDRKNGIYVFKP